MYISYVHSWQEISTSCQWLLKFFCKLFWEQDLVSFEMYLAQQILLLRLCVFRCQILPGWQPSLWNGGLRLYEGWFWISQNICLRFSVTSYGKTWTFWPTQYTHESWQKRRHFCQIHVLRLTRSLPRWLSGKESTYQCRTCRRHGFDPWVGKIPWRRK